MKVIKLYKVLHTTGINDFHDMVRQHIKNGWITQGGLSVIPKESKGKQVVEYYQAVVKV